MHKILILIGTLVPMVSGFGQSPEAYKIEIKINDWPDTTAYIAYYQWEGTYLADTARTKNGVLTFSGSKPLRHGVYIVVVSNKVKGKVTNPRLFDFVVGEDQVFQLSTRPDDFVKNMKVAGDIDNKIFFENLLHRADLTFEADPYIQVLKDSATTANEKREAREKLAEISKAATSFQNDLISTHATTITARLLKATKEIEVPEAPKLGNGQIDSGWQYRYYKQHYWDNFDLADEALLRMPQPLFQEKLKTYLNRLVVPQPDSILNEIARLAVVARKNKETYKYLVWNCLVQYQNHELMGMDAVYVGLYDKFLATGEMDYWMDARTKQNFKKQADQFRMSLIGMDAPNLIMQDQNLKPRSMHNLSNRYTILYFFKPDCGYCREETPKLVSFYNAHKKKYDFEVFAVSLDSSLNQMKDFIKEFNTPWVTVNGPRSYVGNCQKLYDAPTTPTIYIIDNKKKIIAKKPPIESLEGFLAYYEGKQKRLGKP